MDLKGRLKHLTKGMAGSKNIEDGIENGTISDKQADFVWNTMNLVALMEIKGILEVEIHDFTTFVMNATENKENMEHEIAMVNHFIDILVAIKDKVDNSAAGNI